MELRDYLRIVRRRWSVVAVAAILVAIVAFVTAPGPRRRGAPVSGTTYTATVTLLQAPDAGPFTSQSLATTTLLVTHGEVPTRAAAQLHFAGPPAVLAEQVSASADPANGSISITASSGSASTASDTANAFGDALLSYLGDRGVANKQRDVDQLEKTLSDEEGQIHNLDSEITNTALGTQRDLLQSERDALIGQYGRTFSQLDSVEAQSTRPSLVTLQAATPIPHTTGGIIRAPSTRKGRTLAGLLLGVLIGAVGAVALELIGQKVGGRDQTEQLLDLPVIAEIPYLPVWQRRSREPVARTNPSSPGAEAYHLVASSLFAMRAAAHVGGESRAVDPDGGTGSTTEPRRRTPQLVLITSAGAGDGKSSTAANLAVCLAESGRSTVLVDTDFRRPSVHRFFGLDNAMGISDFLGYQVGQLEHFVRPTDCAGVSIISAGPSVANPQSLSSGLRRVLSQARTLADMVIVDTSPLLNGSEVIELLPEADAVLLVCRPGRTSRERARLAAGLLDRFGAPVLGTVLMGERSGIHMPLSPYYWYRDDRMMARRVEPAPPDAAPATSYAEFDSDRSSVRDNLSDGVPLDDPAPVGGRSLLRGSRPWSG